MEDAHNSSPALSRIKCENEFCSKPRTHYCRDHRQTLCLDCAFDLHEMCKCNEIPDSQNVIEGLNAAKLFLISAKESFEHLSSSFINNFEEEFKIYTQILAGIDQKLSKCICDNKLYELSLIMDEVHQFQKTFTESNLYIEFTERNQDMRLAEVNNMSSYDNKFSYICKSFSNIAEDEEIEILLHKRTDHVSENTISANKYNLIVKLSIEAQKINKQLSKTESKQIEEMNEQFQCSEQPNKIRINNLSQPIDEAIRENLIQREKEIRQQEYNIQSTIFSRIYERNLNQKIANEQDFDLTIDLNNMEHKTLLGEIETSMMRLPDIRKIRIDYISDLDADFSNFLSDCTPNQLKSLIINASTNTFALIKKKLDIKSVLKVVTVVTKEIYIRLYEFSAADLQQFIRAACNTERIVIYRCSVHCLPSLDFGTTIRFNTKFLGFDLCGNTNCTGLTTDWKNDPSCFSNIVDAIGNSRLRHSLAKLSIAHNQTLDKQKVQKLLNSKGMAHILVVEDNPGPY